LCAWDQEKKAPQESRYQHANKNPSNKKSKEAIMNSQRAPLFTAKLNKNKPTK
jgi:hypothetical protein